MGFTDKLTALGSRIGQIMTTPIPRLFAAENKVLESKPWEPGAGPLPKNRNAEQWLKAYNRNSLLRSPVSRIATDVAAVRWTTKRIRGYKQDGSLLLEPIHEHPLLRLWSQPNPSHTGFQFRKLLTVYVEMAGVAPVWIERDPDDQNVTPDGFGMRPKHLWPIRPQDLIRRPDEKRPFWEFRLKGRTIKNVREQDVILLVQVDPENPYGFGIGTAAAVDHEVSQAEYMAEWQTNFFRNGAHVGKLVGIQGMPPTLAEEFRQKFEQRHMGVRNAHRVMFVSIHPEAKGGGMPVTDLGPTHKDLDFVTGCKHIRDTILQNWGVPPELVAVVENSNRATADAAKHIQQLNNVAPRIVELFEWINGKVTPLYLEDGLVLVPDNPVQESREFLAESHAEGFSRGAVTRDEYRRVLDLDPLGEPRGNELVVPLNVVGSSSKKQAPALQAVPDSAPDPSNGKAHHVREFTPDEMLRALVAPNGG